MTVTPLIDKKQEKFSKDFASLVGSGDIKAVMARLQELSERTDRLAKARAPK